MNLRPLRPERSALAKLSYIPFSWGNFPDARKLDNQIRFQFGASESVEFPLLDDRIDSFGFINQKGGVDSKDRGAVQFLEET